MPMRILHINISYSIFFSINLLKNICQEIFIHIHNNMENIANESDMVLVNIISKYQDYLITKFVRIT